MTSNASLIQGFNTGAGSTGAAYGMWGGASATVAANTGTISSSTAGSGESMAIRAVTFANITNSSGGVIQGATTGSASVRGIWTGTYATVNNAGGIQATAVSGEAMGVNTTSTASITNSASTSVISGTTTGSSAAYGVYAYGGAATVNSNAGTIYGSAAAGAAYGVYASLAAANIIVTSNAGDIYGASTGSNMRGPRPPMRTLRHSSPASRSCGRRCLRPIPRRLMSSL